MATTSEKELVMTVLGCGTMGIAITSGILASLKASSSSTTSTPEEELPSRLPSRFIGCVGPIESAAKLAEDAFKDYSSVVRITQVDNVGAVEEAEVILLSCKPYMVKDILSEKGMAKALGGKLLISICAGVTVDQIEGYLCSSDSAYKNGRYDRCNIVRAMPNTASMIRESMTVIQTEPPLPSKEASKLVTWIFKRIGDVVYLPPKMMDVSTSLCGSGPAFFALMLEAAIDGAVAMGLPRAEAQRMAAQTMKGTAALIQNGEHPALLRDKVSTPGGCTIGGLLVLEEGRVRGSVARAVREATVVASQLGQGAQGVNGTRFPTNGPHL